MIRRNENAEKTAEAIRHLNRLGVKFDRASAWLVVDEIVDGDYELDAKATMEAGYPIFRTTFGDWVSDLNDRLEVNYEKGAKSVNVWLKG